MSISYPYPLPPSYYPPVQAASAAAVAPAGPVFTPVPDVKMPDVKKVITLPIIEDVEDDFPDTILKVSGGDTVVEEPWPINPVTGKPISRQAMYKRRKKGGEIK
jgi:hypothetical protein